MAAALSAVPAGADWVKARGERVFGPEMAEADACRAAEERAREDALRRRLGEHLAAEDLLACSERGGKAECDLHRSVWTTLDGDIRAVRDRRVETRDGPLPGFRVCTVSLFADVGVAIGRPDPSFDLKAALNTRVFRDGDSLALTIRPTQPMYLAVFQWQPDEGSPHTVSRLFPNAMDSGNRFDGPGTIPTAAGAQRYSFTVSFPAGLAAGRDDADEYLLVVATRKKVDFLDSYDIDAFKGRLLEIPRSDSRLVKLAYMVVRAPPVPPPGSSMETIP